MAAAPIDGAAAQDQIVLRGITPWVADYALSHAFFDFQTLVEEKFGDRVRVDYLGGPEIADPNNQFAALKNGVVDEIGRESCRERVCQEVSISVVGGSLKKKTT